MRLEFEDVNETIAYFAKKLLAQKPIVSTNKLNEQRYKKQLGGELVQQFFVIKNPTKILCTYQNHKWYKWWLYGEILSEFLNLSPPIMYKYRPEMYSLHYDLVEDGTQQYSYSSRFTEFNEFVNTYRQLKANPNSKRCYVPIFVPWDTFNGINDRPCTLGYSFLHRNGKLNMTVFYRSHDFFGGMKTYDYALSSFILQAFCSWLGFKLGDLGFYDTSLHFYERNRKLLENLVKEIDGHKKTSDEFVLDGKLTIDHFYNELRAVKSCEEAAFAGNFDVAVECEAKCSSKLLKDMCSTFMKKNQR